MRSDPSPKRALRVLVAALAPLTLAPGCADFTRGLPAPPGADGPPPVVEGDGGVADAPSFAADIHPLLLSRCQSCHGAGGAASTTAYVLSGEADDDYALNVPFIDESAPGESRLVSKASGVGHAGGALFPVGSDEHDLLVRWIAQGALP